MSRTRTLITVLIPAALVGSLVAAPASRADDDDDVRAAQAEAKAQLKAARKQAKQQLKSAREQIANAPMPENLRDRLLEKLDKIAEKVDERLQDALSQDFSDLEGLEDQMEAMGEALEAEMEQMGEEWEQFGEDFERQFKDSWGAGHPVIVIPEPPEPPDFDPHDLPVPPVAPTPPTAPRGSSSASSGIDIDLGDLDLSIDVTDLDLAADQIDALGTIFEDQQDLVDPATEKLEDVAEELRTALADPDSTEAEVGKLVDELSAQEAVIRKAQIVAWVKSRNLLDDDQRAKVQRAKVKRKRVR